MNTSASTKRLILPNQHGSLRSALLVFAYVATYVFLDWASYIYPIVPLGITPFNPPPGLSVFFLLWAGLRYWPALFASAIAADLVVRGIPTHYYWTAGISAALITLAYTGATGALTRHSRLQLPIESPRDLMSFLLAIAGASLLLAVTFVGLYAMIGLVAPSDIALDTLRYWVGDLNGILVLTPALLHLVTRRSVTRPLTGPERIEVGLQLASLVACLCLVFAFAGDYPYRSFYILFLPLIWISTRWGLAGAMLTQIVIQLGLIVGVQLADYHSTTFVQLQLLMTGLCVTGLTLGSLSTHRSRLQEELQGKQAALNRAQQLASAGEMTSALAHQLNQPIAALTGYLGACDALIARSDIDPGRLREMMSKALTEAWRASDVVSRLRDFYQRGATSPEWIDSFSILANVTTSLRPNAERLGVRIQLRNRELAISLYVDIVQVENALQNILQNAIEAASIDVSGKKIVEASHDLQDRCVCIRIRDSGPGVGPEIASLLFEPFNTTKSNGMGMGLAIARSLVEANGGGLKLESSGLGGSCFLMSFPLTKGGGARK
ncbi:MAG: MASE1 domain-containing protein [Ferrovibrio sp.]|uniref:MASE1 domain-containing protein n=1 Tax=Ferrovibrio sp. TaxID=1917215 RepID=UPI00262ECF9F|nr:MASE1 domain-containing protein [Ferrovibrio sp.]MCW0235757.1 MASE1 domain-containing protein [Ferrovibrio sp.]